MAFLYCISTGEFGGVDLIKTTRESTYGKYTAAFKEVYQLGVGWGYGISKSLEMIADKVSTDKTDQLKQLLMKLAQVLRLGDALKSFFGDELKATLTTYVIVYERKLENEKLFLEMFYTLMSTAAFMIAANSIMSMLMGQENSEQILLMSFIGVAASMSAFVFMMYIMFPRDKLGYASADEDLKFRLKIYMTIGAGVGIGVVLLFTQILPTTLAIGIAGAPLLYPGMLARKMEQKVKQLNDWYPQFIRHFGEIYATVGSVGGALEAVLRSDFGPLQENIQRFKNRIKHRVEQKMAFELLSRDTGSQIIANGNEVISYAMDKGGNLNLAGNHVSDITVKINELRAKRTQTAKTFETIILVLHALTLAVFGLMNKLTGIFYDLVNTVDVSNDTLHLTPIDPQFMALMMPLMILMTSSISAMALKVAQGGLYKTVFYHMGLLIVIGSVVMFVMDVVLSDYLAIHVLDFAKP
ncbi:MAG: flagellar assembly protein FlaJ [Thaumarchaeota archaeon]|nr:flagellar assembly protein FlaJ [Nitrososphaerota archaeon]